jgi:multisubunit Na+/H+ antiporter MnhB subunit
MAGMSQDALLGLLFPFWQLAIGGCVLITVLLCTRRLLRRGPSRMTRALVVTGGAAIGLATLGILLAGR